MPFGAVWGGSEASKLYFICTTLFTVICNKMTKPASLLTHSSFVAFFVAVRSFALLKSKGTNRNKSNRKVGSDL